MSNITNIDTNNTEEERIEKSLRPKTFAEVIGLELCKKSLKVMIESSKKTGDSLDHILFYGPPGLGKTTLAFVTANEMSVPFHVTSGLSISKPGDLAAILTSLEPHSILFIDEIHRLKKTIEEILYPAMEDSAIDIVIGKGPNAKTLRLDLPPFTIIGATTKLSMLSAPLRDRFGMQFRTDFYDHGDLASIVKQKAQILEYSVDDDAAEDIAKRSRMTPRIAIRILKRARDIAVVGGQDSIAATSLDEVFSMLKIDELGLNEIDREILKSLIQNFDNQPVGLGTLAASISEEPETVEQVNEPFLLKMGLLKRTPRGRVATNKAIEFMNFDIED